MPIKEINKNKAWTPLVVSLILVLGAGLGMLVQRHLTNTKPLDKFLEREDPIDEIISLIQFEYVDSVSRDSLYFDAVNGILSHLDPHTVYIPASQVIQSNEILEGTGKGLGIEYFFLKDSMLVTNVSDGSPAQKSGVKIGDRIIKVNGKAISGINISEEEAVNIFKESDTLSILLMHSNKIEISNVKIVRGDIETNSVSTSNMLSDLETGYIKLDIFSSKSYNETVAAIEKLQKKGMKNLILDLRENGGGYLDEAVNLADEFLDGKKILVTLNGKKGGKYDFSAFNKGVFEEGRLIILINENSASASEVLAGAIQDWDRGLIIGNNSYGKGLVQEQYGLSDGSAIRITTERYYTPAGRSIQRPYDNGRVAYKNMHNERPKQSENGKEVFGQEGTVYYSLKNLRALYANGGIYPDVLAESNLTPHSAELEQMIDNFVLDNFINTYFFSDFKKDYDFEDFNAFNEGFKTNTEFMNKMKQYFIKQDAIFTDRIWENPRDMFFLKTQTKAMIAKLAYGPKAYHEIHILNDSCIQKAFEVITDPEVYNRLLNPKKPLD